MSNDHLIGKNLDEYRLEELLGQGGMARVYRALDTRLKRRVAIKVIDAPFRSDSDYIIRFEREAQAIAQLEHSNVVSIYRYGKVNDMLYIAMKYVEGIGLDLLLQEYQARGDYMPSADALKIIQDVCQALDYIHSKGIIHRDIKPANIILNRERRAILADFGLALLESAGTQGEIFGTPHYIAPEQAISSAGAVPQSDLYAVGVILYEMFTGIVPFNADTALSIAMQHMSEPPEPPRQIRPEISREVEAVILKTLKKEPQDRYSSGAELVAALEKALQTHQITALPVSSDASVIDRVAVGLAEHPLPPLPAGVAAAKSEPTLPAIPVSTPATVPETRVKAEPAQSTALSTKKGQKLMLYGLFGSVIVLLIGIYSLSVRMEFFLRTGRNTQISHLESANQALTSIATSTPTASETAPILASAENVAILGSEPGEPTFTAIPPRTPTPDMVASFSPVPPTATNSPTPQPEPTDTPVPPTATKSPTPQPEPTDTPVPPTATNSPTPQPEPTSTPTPKTPQPIADTRTDFSGTQGTNNWNYQWSRGRESFNWVDMRFDGKCWRIDGQESATEPSVRICQNSVHPGLTGDIAWRWTSTQNENIWIQVSAYKIDASGGDGVDIIIYRNTDKLQHWHLNGNDSKGFSEGLLIDVIAGDYIFAVIKIGGDSTYDETGFRIQIYS